MNSRRLLRRVGTISFPLCITFTAVGVVPTKSDAPSYVEDVFNQFQRQYPIKQGKMSPDLDTTNQLSQPRTRIGVIGAGPSGLSLLNAFNKELTIFNDNKENVPFEVIVFDKQKQIGGLWRYDYRTGTDQYGIPIHSSQYEHLWSNGPFVNYIILPFPPKNKNISISLSYLLFVVK